MPSRFDIDIELYAIPDATAPDIAVLQAEIAQGLAELWPALGLPAEPVVSLRHSPEPFDLFDFSIQLDGQWVPVPVYHPAQKAAPLAFRILSTLFRHRTRLITDEQLRQLRAQCLETSKVAPSWSSAPLSVWRSLATLLLQNGFSLERLSACFEHWRPEKSAEEAFETLIENPDILALQLVVHPDLAQAQSTTDPGWETRFPELYRQIYQDLGILLPVLQLETAAEPGVRNFRLRLNDLWLPVLPGPEPGVVLYDNPAQGHFYAPAGETFLAEKPPADDPFRLPDMQGPWAYVLSWVEYWVSECGAWFVNTGITDALMDKLEETNRSLIIMTREQWPSHRICAILRELLGEKVSIRNLPEILDVLLRIDGPVSIDDTRYRPFFPPVSRVAIVPPGTLTTMLSTTQLAGQVRANLKYPLAYPYLKAGVLPCYAFEAAILRDFREGFFRDQQPRPDSAFHTLLRRVYEQTQADFPKPVFLTPGSARSEVAAALRPYFPGITVLSQEEIAAFVLPGVKSTITIF